MEEIDTQMAKKLFQPGHEKIPGSGRAPGQLNKLTISVRQAFEEAFDEIQKDPNANLVAWGIRNPNGFYMLASKLIPTKIEAKVEDVTKRNKMILPDGTIVDF